MQISRPYPETVKSGSAARVLVFQTASPPYVSDTYERLGATAKHCVDSTQYSRHSSLLQHQSEPPFGLNESARHTWVNSERGISPWSAGGYLTLKPTWNGARLTDHPTLQVRSPRFKRPFLHSSQETTPLQSHILYSLGEMKQTLLGSQSCRARQKVIYRAPLLSPAYDRYQGKAIVVGLPVKL